LHLQTIASSIKYIDNDSRSERRQKGDQKPDWFLIFRHSICTASPPSGFYGLTPTITAYILIVMLLSFGIAMITGIIVVKLVAV